LLVGRVALVRAAERSRDARSNAHRPIINGSRRHLRRAGGSVKRVAAMMRLLVLCAALGIVGCANKQRNRRPSSAGQPIDVHELTADEVARAVQITPRGDDVFFRPRRSRRPR
jgi:hypothetical protein